jgi:YVTN family beta-propeller protein
MLCLLDSKHCLLGDSFGGALSVLDIESGTLRSWLRINGHNIRGMSLTPDGKTVVITHQILHEISSTTRSIISWGGVISNTLHSIPVKRLLAVSNAASKKPQSIHGALYPLGEERNAAGDPADVVIDGNGRLFVALAGVDQVCRKKPRSFELARTSVGRHPTKLLLDESLERLYAVNTFSDTISVLDSQSLRVSQTIRLGKVATRSFSQSGEEHFFDARLSLDGWFSCHSCHSDGHTTNLLNDNFGDSTFNTPKRILSLLGTGSTEPWGWNGGQIDLRNQIRASIDSTMGGPAAHGPKINDRLVESVNSYISKLPPAPGILTARGEANRPSVKRGAKTFKSRGCVDCHRPPTYAHPLTFDVGIHDEAGNMYFNPPSLLGVSQRGPYFHDNRAKSLRDVIENHDHDGASALKPRQIDDLIDFLKSL